MNISQDTLINQIAKKENINIATVRQIFRSAENIIFDYLSSTTPSEDVSIKLFNGISIKRNFLVEKKYSKGMFRGINCPEHVNIRAYISKYYNDLVNNGLKNQVS